MTERSSPNIAHDTLDLGRDHTLTITWWDPDLALNRHITFDTPIARRTTDGPFWSVESWEPLTVSPSVLCNCGDHGYIRGARWIPA